MATQSIGQQIGRFRLQQLLGGTALAVVYRAIDEANGTDVGLKLLRSYFTQEPALVGRFVDAMEQVRTLRHPGIVTPLESGTDGANVWVVLPYIPWRTAQQRLEDRGGPLHPAEALRILKGAADALDYAHQHGAVHLDLKPGNIFVGEDQVQVEGFGMVTLAVGVHWSMRVTLNTPHPAYMAPEQAEEADAQEPTYDVYALATIAYELLTGTVPFLGIGESALVKKRVSRPPPPSQVNPALPKEVDRVLLRALHHLPTERFESAGVLVAALEEALGALGSADALPEPPAEVQALPEVEPPGEVEVGEVICRVCGQDNPATLVNCLQCWSVLSEELQPTREAADRKERRTVRSVRRTRVLRAVGIIGGALAISLFLYAETAGGFGQPEYAASTSVASIVAPGDWAMHGLDFAQSAATAVGPSLRGELAWTFQSAAPLLASPAVVGNRVYLPSGDRRIVALDAADGAVLWEAPTTGPVDSSPTVAGDTVYIGLRDGRVLALRDETGAVRWEYETGNPIMGGVIVHEGVAYVGSGDGELHAIDAALGTQLWTYDSDGWIATAPAVYENRVAVTNFRGWIHVVDRNTGLRRLTYQAFSGNISGPTFVGDEILVGLDRGRMLAIDSTKLEYLTERRVRWWRAQFFIWGLQGAPPVQKGFSWSVTPGSRGSGQLTGPAALEGVAYFGAADGMLRALDIESRETLWAYKTGAAVKARPVVAGDTVYVADGNGGVHAVDRSSGDARWTFQTGGKVTAQPVVAGGTLYVASQNGTFYAIR